MPAESYARTAEPPPASAQLTAFAQINISRSPIISGWKNVGARGTVNSLQSYSSGLRAIRFSSRLASAYAAPTPFAGSLCATRSSDLLRVPFHAERSPDSQAKHLERLPARASDATMQANPDGSSILDRELPGTEGAIHEDQPPFITHVLSFFGRKARQHLLVVNLGTAATA